ncbi:MAG: RDD family protein [Bryobacterales bacterium]|nr:RDD family protein [Bryobacterales bacterium]
MKLSKGLFGNVAIALALLATASAQEPDRSEGRKSAGQARQSGFPAHVRVGSSLELPAGDRAEDVVVILGSATINGTAEGDVVVVLGTLALGSTSVIEGDTVVVGGSMKVLPGAVAKGDLAVVGGALDAPPEFSPEGELAVVGAGPGPAEVFAPVLAWVTKGLLWGRPLVPQLLSTWILVVLFALLYLATNWIFERPVRDAASALSSKPLTCFLVGGAVVLLIGPVSLLLITSFIGLPAVPLLWFAVFLTVMMGRVGVARWIGGRVMPEQFPGNRAEAARSVAIGFALLCLAYMVPVLGFTAWTVLGVLALGAATTSVATSWRRENPKSAEPDRVPTVAVAQLGQADAPELNVPDGAAVDRLDGEPIAGETTPIDRTSRADLPLASFPARACAVALDLVPFAILGHTLDIRTLLLVLLFVIYNSAMWTLRGTTVGGMICRIRVIRTDGCELATADGIVRGLASVVSIAFLGLGWFWSMWDEKRQSWHDRAAGTYVVRTSE